MKTVIRNNAGEITHAIRGTKKIPIKKVANFDRKELALREAAPAMLEALKYCVETFRPSLRTLKITKDFSKFNAMATAQKAIDKAEGKIPN